jgi:UDP-N-acetylmuramate dehydrogenase
VTVIGVGSNLLVRDGGIPGLTIRMGRGCAGITIEGDEVLVGASALDRIVSCTAAEAGIGGLEFLSGIPGSIGGSVRMNAGAYGREIKDVLVSATALDRTGRAYTIDGAAMGFSYRHSNVEPSWILVEARLRGAFGDRFAIASRLTEIRAAREATQPVRARTGGSTFKNPPGESAWNLIEAAGCRGLSRGGAMVSEKHTNFLINTGNATAADLEGLGEEVRRRVYETSGIVLEWEIERIGRTVPEIGRPLKHLNPSFPRKERVKERPFEGANSLVIPGWPEGTGLESMNTGSPQVSQACVPGFRAHGPCPRPGMTTIRHSSTPSKSGNPGILRWRGLALDPRLRGGDAENPSEDKP